MTGRRIDLLEHFRIDGQDGTSLVTSGKERAMLAALALRPGSLVLLGPLARSIWDYEQPDRLPHDPTQTTRTYAQRLRASTGLTIQGRDGGYVLHATPDEVDALVYLRLVSHADRLRHLGKWEDTAQTAEDAFALWQSGPPLPAIPASPVQHIWTARLQEERLALIAHYAEAAVHLGRAAETLPRLAGLVAAHPLNESLRGAQMRALYYSGRQADAILAFQDLKETLANRLGLDPTAGLRHLYELILTGKLSADG